MTTEIIKQAEGDLQKSYEFLQKEFSSLHTGRADIRLVEDIEIDAYGAKQPLKHVAGISVADAQSLVISPWDKGMLAPIEKAIENNPKLSFSVKNDGVVIRLFVPTLTGERRKEIVKVVHSLAEKAKIGIRNIRHELHNTLKTKKDGKEISEDDFFRTEKELQEKVDAANKKIDELAKHKEGEILTV